ncbi:MAG: outer membrane beta-barrel protein [Paludibacter sp.]
MKKILPFILALSFVFSVYSQKKTSFTGWSFTAEVGLNYFDGDIPQGQTQIFPTSIRTVSYGGTIEYALTPIWGLSLDGYFFPLKGPLGEDKTINNVNTNLFTSDLNATINFTRWIFPESKSKLYVIGSIGLGFARYNYNVLDNNGDPVSPLATEYNKNTTTVGPVLVYDGLSPLKTGTAGSCPVTLAVEYNFSKYIAAGLKAHYRAYTKDNIEGVSRLNWQGVTNDFVAAGQVYLRYKINVLHKDHKRNIRMEEYLPNTALELAKANADRINKLD